MSLSLQQCIEKVKEAQPELYPVSYIEDRGKYLINMLKRGVAKDEAIANFYVVDSDNGKVGGPIPVMMIMENEELADKLSNPHMISGEDQKKLVHSEPAKGLYWGVSESDSLSHHGIKGQRWGIRRFQNEDGSLTKEGRERYYGPVDQKKMEKLAAKQEYEAFKKELKEISKSNLPRKEKKQLKTAKIADKVLDNLEKDYYIDREVTKKNDSYKRLAVDTAFTVLNPYNAAYLLADSARAVAAKHKVNKYMKEREKKSEYDEKIGLYIKKEGSYDEKQDLAAVNPGYMDMNSNSKNNCMLCTTTYELRKRGYDVTAQLDRVGYSFPDLRRWFPKADIQKVSRYDENGKGLSQKEYVDKTIKSLLKQGDGAHGNMMVFWNLGGGHSIYYEVQNGKVIFKDSQTNKVYKQSDTNSLLKIAMTPEKLLNQTLTNSFARLDNVEPDLERIKKECVR